MTDVFSIHPEHPQQRLIRRSVDVIQRGGIIAYPTDSAYALGCQLGNKDAIDRIRRIRELDKNHNFTLICRDLTQISTYARIDNVVFRFWKSHIPGPYTFILKASGEVPKRLQHPKRKTIGLRVPESLIVQALLEALDEPLLSVSLILPGDELPLGDAETIYDALSQRVDLVIDGGFCGFEPSTVVELTSGVPEVVRQGKGEI